MWVVLVGFDLRLRGWVFVSIDVIMWTVCWLVQLIDSVRFGLNVVLFSDGYDLIAIGLLLRWVV